MVRKNSMKIGIVLLVAAISTFSLSACGETATATDKDELAKHVITVDYTDRDTKSTSEEDGSIVMNGDSVSSTSEDVTYKDNIVTINKEGTYRVSGELTNGQIAINVGDDDKVQLLLDNANINCNFGPAIYSDKGDKIFITTVKGTTNTVTDGKEYTFDGDQPYGAIFATCGITLNGEGLLKVTGNYNNGIVSKDDLKITGGTIQVSAINNGIKGTDSVAIKDGVVNVTSTGDGIKSSKEDNEKKGYIAIEGGDVKVVSGTDGLQAENILQVTDGIVNVETAGGYQNATKAENVMGKDLKDKMHQGPSDATENSDDVSAKGLKGGNYVLLTGGNIAVNALDDALHTNGSMLVGNAKLALQSGDDGIHADSLCYVNMGNVNITNSYEGIEGAQIIVDDGTINITASDDGFNAAGGNDSSGKEGPMVEGPGGGEDKFASSEDCDYKLEINGGKINVNSEGDGLDSNKDIVITGGEIYVNGPTNSGNGALDCGEESNGKATITGGTIIAVGSSGMAIGFDSESTQASLMYNVSGQKGDEVILKDSSGKEILKYTAVKQFGNIVISTPLMKQGEKYTLSVGENNYDVELTEISTSYGQQNRQGGGRGGEKGGPGQKGSTEGGGNPQDMQKPNN